MPEVRLQAREIVEVDRRDVLRIGGRLLVPGTVEDAPADANAATNASRSADDRSARGFIKTMWVTTAT
jgi:hypothetical protein